MNGIPCPPGCRCSLHDTPPPPAARDEFQPHSNFEHALAMFVDGLKYGDDWTFTLDRVGADPILRVQWVVDDLHNPGGRTVLAGALSFSEYAHRGLARFAVMQVYEMIGRLEAHERLERFRWRGDPMWDAHPGGEFATGPYGDLPPALAEIFDRVPA